jgi:ribose transport system ATP-binding protein
VTSAVPAAFRAAGASSSDALVVENLSKRFGGELALDAVDLTVRRGEVHGLLGANGSGKSTLIKILAGFHAPEPGGRVGLFDVDLPLPVHANAARALGMAFVHQNLALIPSLSLTENMRLTHFATAPDWRISWRREHEAVAETLSRYGLRLNPRVAVSSLSSAEQALFAIVRAVEDLGGASAGSRGRLLVLDEPTPFLPRVGVDQLFGLIRQVVAEGASVIFVSHDISEVMEITDRATVLRDGVLVGVLETRSASHADFVERIVGRSVQLYRGRGMKAAERAPIARIVDLMAAGLGPVTLTVGKGEIVGLTGLIGSGFDRVCAAAYGAVPAMRGVLELDRGQSLQSIALPSIEPPRSIDAGVVYLPADRLGAAGVGGLSVVENEMLPMLDRMRGRFGLDRRRMMRAAGKLGAEFNVKPNAPFLPLMALSGGNQQKALMAKWLQTKPQLILLDEPTQGVDVGARQQLLAALDGASLEGAGILMASTDWEQLAQICHRVIVFAHGVIVAELTGADLNEEAIAECCYHSMTHIA